MGFWDVLWWMLVAALVVPAHRAAFHRGAAWLAALVCADLIALALTAAAYFDSFYESVAQEDGVIEWATTYAFLGAALLSALALRRSAPWLENVVRLGFVLFCVVVAGEEVSWGQRLVGFQPPEVFLERNFQQELNLHNILMDENASGLGFELDSKFLVIAIAVVFGLLGPLLVRLKLFRCVESIAPPVVLAPLFLAVVASEVTYPISLIGEGAELLLGFLFLIAAAVGRGPRAIVLSAIVTLGLASVTAPLLARLVYGSDEEGLAQTRAEIEVLARDLTEGTRAKIYTKSSVHKRVFTATRDGYYALERGAFVGGGEATGDDRESARRRYFLDPWNNPYWLFVERDERRVVLYSFGPNRRRDSDVKRRNGAKGDDVMVEVELPARR